MQAQTPPYAMHAPPPPSHAGPGAYGNDAFTPAEVYASVAPPVHAKGSPPYFDDENESSHSERLSSDRFWRDWPFLIAFILAIGGLIAVTVYGANQNVDCETPGLYQGLIGCSYAKMSLFELTTIIMFLLILGAIIVVTASIYLQLVRAFTYPMIIIGMVVTVLTMATTSAYLFWLGSLWGGAFLAIFTIISAVYLILIRDRIPFAVQVIRLACRLVSKYPATQVVAILALFVNFGILMWFTYAIFVSQRFNSFAGVILSLIYLVLLLYWMLEVVKNVVHVTTSGVVATWYFLQDNIPRNPTLSSLRRSVTTSLGSITFGSLIVAFIKTLRFLVRMATNHENGLCMFFAACCFACLDWIVQYFNHYAFCYVAIYGHTFIQSAKATWRLFKSSGFEAIANDWLLDGILWMGTLLGAIIGATVGILLSLAFPLGGELWPGLLIGLAMGFVLTRQVLQPIDSAIACIFVCFAESPETLQRLQPDMHRKFMEAYYN